ncbi:MAG TPA: hypothetical protein VM368_02105 [Flavisolibacter sp.]|nr:hypothetical protein [Flavisolibacter sp.]
MKNGLIISSLLLFNSCIFSGTDFKETKLIGNYYITSMGGMNALVYREPNSLTDNVIVTANIDSFFVDSNWLVVSAGKEYFFINQEKQSIDTVYHNYEDLMNRHPQLKTKFRAVF